jgi:hypothetical protein
MKFGFSILALNVALAGAVAPAAMAQSSKDNQFFRHRFIAVTERAQPEYDPQPLHAGAFLINSSLAVGAAYNDNIYAQKNKTGDTILNLTPRVNVKSNWSSNEVNAGVLVDYRKYLDNDSESVTDYSGHVGGRLDVTRDFSVGGTATAGRLSESRYAPSAIGNAAEPVRYDQYGGLVNANYHVNRILLAGDVSVTKADYDNVALVGGGVLNQNFRDATTTDYGGRASYAVSPDVAVFLQARHTDVNYRVSSVPDRDSTRNFYQVGTNFELAAPFRGDIAVGYLDSKKASGGSFSGLAVDGNVQWFPTEITTVTLNARRTVFDPGLLTSSIAFDTSVGVRVDHELRRNIVLFGNLGYDKLDYKDIDRKDDITTFGAGVDYKLNRRAWFEFAYTLRDQDTKGASGPLNPLGPVFTQNIVSATLRLFP